MIVYLYLGGKVVGTVQEGSIRENCRNSVILNVKTQNVAGIEPEPLNCHTQFVDVRAEGIFKNENSIDSEVTADSVQRAIANEMYDCWYMFLQGSQEVFERTFQRPFPPPFDEEFKTQCVVCSEISINSNNDQDVTTQIGGDIPDLLDWLQKNEIQQYSSDSQVSKVTYYDYLGRTLPTSMTYDELLTEMTKIVCGDDPLDWINCNWINRDLLTIGKPGIIKVPGEYAVIFKTLTPVKINLGNFKYHAAVYIIEKDELVNVKCDHLY